MVRLLPLFPLLVALVLVFSYCPAPAATKEKPVLSPLPEKKLETFKKPAPQIKPSTVPSLPAEIKKAPAVRPHLSRTIYCCVNGRVVKTSSDRSIYDPDVCSANRMELEQRCGFCCRDGEATPVTTNAEYQRCLKERGQLVATRAECGKLPVFCLTLRGIEEMLAEQCRNLGGTGYPSPAEARATQSRLQVYCCVDGGIKRLPAAVCRKVRGLAYQTRQEAAAACGWCCRDGEATAVSSADQQEQCDKPRLLYASEAEAALHCRAKPGYCVTDQGMTLLSEQECLKQKGRFFTGHLEAQRFRRKTAAGPLIESRRPELSVPPETRLHLPETMKPQQRFDIESRPQPVPLLLERGIWISRPAGGNFHRGDSLTVAYTITRVVPDEATVVLNLKNRTDPGYVLEIARTTAGEARSPQQFDWSIPLTTAVFPGNDFYIQGRAGDHYGESNYFSIDEERPAHDAYNAFGIEVSLDPSRSLYRPGESVNLRFRYTGTPPASFPQDVQVYLHRREDPLSRMAFWPALWSIASGGHRYDPETREHTIALRMPDREEYQRGSWVISVIRSSSAWGRTRSFSIGEITEGGGDSPGTGISLIYPNGGERLVSDTGITHEVQWYHWGPLPLPNASIELRRYDGRPIHAWRVSAADISFDERTRICRATISMNVEVGGETHLLPPGESFTIRVNSGAHQDESGPFAIVGPLVVDGIYELGTGRAVDTLYWWHFYQVRWRRLSGSTASVDIHLLDGSIGNRVVTLGSARLSSGSFNFSAPTRFGDRLLVVEQGEPANYALSDEFTIEAPTLSVSAPAAGTIWRNGEIHNLEWRTEHFPRTLPYPPYSLTVSIDLVGPEGRDCLARNVPLRNHSYRWRVAYGPCITYGDPGSPEGVAEYGTGHMGGIPDTLTPGRYRLVLQLEQGGIISMSEEFRIE